LKNALAALIERYQQYPQFLGIEISEPNQRAAMNDTMLHFAAESGATGDIEVLVASGAEVNAIGDIGNTPLHGAAMMGRFSAAKRLLDLGADPTIKNELGQKALDVAEIGGHERLAELLRTISSSS